MNITDFNTRARAIEKPDLKPLFTDVMSAQTDRAMKTEIELTGNNVGMSYLRTATGHAEGRWDEIVNTIRKAWG